MTFSPSRVLLLIGVLLAMLALPAFIAGKDAPSLLANLSTAYLLIFLVLTLTRWACLTIRWHLLLKTNNHPINKTRLLNIVLASDFAAENTPAGTGGLAANLFLFKQEGVPITLTTCCSTLLFLNDLAAVAIWLICALAFVAVPEISQIYGYAITGGLAFLTASILLWLMLKNPHWLERSAQKLRLHLFLSTKIQKKIKHNWLLLTQAATAISKTATAPLLAIFGLSLLNWGIRFSLLFLVITALGGDIALATVAVIQFVSGLAGLVSTLPGGFPGTDLSIIAMLQLSLPMPITLSALLLWRLLTYHLSFVVGGLSFFYLVSRTKLRAE